MGYRHIYMTVKRLHEGGNKIAIMSLWGVCIILFGTETSDVDSEIHIGIRKRFYNASFKQ